MLQFPGSRFGNKVNGPPHQGKKPTIGEILSLESAHVRFSQNCATNWFVPTGQHGAPPFPSAANGKHASKLSAFRDETRLRYHETLQCMEEWIMFSRVNNPCSVELQLTNLQVR